MTSYDVRISDWSSYVCSADRADFARVVDALALQHMLLDEAAREGGELAVGILAVLDPRDHAGQRLRGLRRSHDQLVGIVPDFGIGGEAALHGLDVARWEGRRGGIGG